MRFSIRFVFAITATLERFQMCSHRGRVQEGDGETAKH